MSMLLQRASAAAAAPRLLARRGARPVSASAAVPASSSSGPPAPASTSTTPSPPAVGVERLASVPVVLGSPPLPAEAGGPPPPPPPADLRPTGGDGGGGDGASPPSTAWSRFDIFSRLAAGVRARAAADPAFAYKLAVECGLDAAIILCVNAGARGWDARKLGAEAEFVLSQVAVSLLNDFALVYLLAPTTAAGAVMTAAAAAAAVPAGFSASLRARLASLPSHVLARGPYPLSSRAACFAARAGQYGCVGFSMGVLGSAIVSGLTAAREAADPAWTPPPTRQSILGTGVGWCWFMATSSNLRYNLVNGAEDLLYGAAAAGSVIGLVPRVGSVALRLANNVAGARGWLETARALKLEQPRLSRAERAATAAVEDGKVPVTAGWGWRKRAAAAAAAAA